MAIYHCSAQVISRSDNRSAVAAAAYRSGTVMKNEYNDNVHDFTYKSGVEYSEVSLCKNAPEKYYNREILWNDIEKMEQADGRLAREFDIAIPRELKTLEERISFSQTLIERCFTSKNILADWALHNKEKHDPNPHIHVMNPLRSIDDNGKFEWKYKKAYLVKNQKGEEVAMTSDEWNKRKEEGWEKQLPYYKNGNAAGKAKPIYLTKTEAETNPKYKNYKRVKGKNDPKKTKEDVLNPNIAFTNSVEFLVEIRKEVADVINETLEKLGYEQRVSHLSLKDQGITDIEPQIHIGVAGNAMHKKGKKSDRYEENERIKKRNAEVEETKKEIRGIEKNIEELTHQSMEISSEIRWDKLKEDCREIIKILDENWYDETLNTEVLYNIDKYKIELDELVELEQQYNLHKENVYELYGNSYYKVSFVDYHFSEIIQEIETIRGIAERNLDEIDMERNPEKYPFLFDKPEKENGVAVKESEPKSTERKKNIFERVVEGVSSVVANRAAKKAEEAARKAAEERKRKEAAEAAQKAAEEQAAAAVARRQAARVAEQQRLADISSVKEECERRLNELQGSIFRKLGWDDFEGGRVLNRIKYNEKPSEYPVAYKDSYGKLKMKIFTADELQLAKEFINQTKEIFDETVEKRRKEIRDFQNISLNDKIKAGEEIHKQQKENRPEREIKRSSGKDERG